MTSLSMVFLLLSFFLSACGGGSKEDSSLKLEEAFIHYELGMDYYGIGEIDKAMEEWEEAVKLNPDTEARHMLGHAYFSKGNTDGARREWEYILSKDANNFMALNNLGNLFKKLKDSEKALDYYSRAAVANPQAAMPHYNIGTVYKEKGELNLAKEKFLKALELDPQITIAMLEMGNIFWEEGAKDQAISYFIKLTEGEWRKDEGFDPKVAGYSSLGRLYLEMRNFEESEKSLKKGLEIQPSNATLHYSLGNLYEAMGKIEEAKEEYKLTLQLDPKFPHVYNGLANLYSEMGGNLLDEAESLILKGLEIDPDLKDHFLDTLGWVYFRQGKLDDALAKVEEAIGLTPADKKESLSTKHYHLGMIYKAKGDKEKALENFKKSMELYPEGENAKKANKNIG
jgi:tetratricopeptide (TPR) repeat protein